MNTIDLKILDEYFSGSLDEDQRDQFENRLKNDVEFKKLYEEYRELHRGIEYSNLKEAKEKLQAIESSLPEIDLDDTHSKEGRSLDLKRSYVWKMAAAVLVIAVSSVLVINYQQSQPEALYAKYFEPYPNEYVHAKRGDESTDVQLLQAFQAYDRGEYDAAIADFKVLLEEDNENLMVLFYLGNAQLAAEEGAACIITLERFLEISQDDFINEAKWYLAMGYLKEGRKEEAKRLFHDIENSSEFGLRASGIIKKLD